MKNPIDENISTLIDGELDAAECDQILDEMCQSDELKQRWQRYHLIKEILRYKHPRRIYPDLSQTVMTAIEAEPTVLVPPPTPNKPFLTPITKRFAGVAIAASVAAIAVIGVQSTYSPAPGQQVATMPTQDEFIRLPSANPGFRTASTASQTSSLGSTIGRKKVSSVSRSRLISPIPHETKRSIDPALLKYLVHHTQNVSSSRIQGLMPYARIVALTTEPQGQAQQ